MNTIPIIFNEKITPYTAVGCKERVASNGISAVVLNQPGSLRRHFFQELEKTGFDNIISIETASAHYDIEELSGKFPSVRFILPKKEISLGEQINLAASETESPLFFVMRSDLKIISGGTAKRIAERLSIKKDETDKNEENNTGFKRLCTIPVIVNSDYEPLPTLRVPVTLKNKLRTAIMEGGTDGQLSLYPFNGIGIFDRRRFIQLGGFDITIKNSYWQFLDFGFRAYLWGEEIALSLHLKLLSEGKMPADDYAVDKCYWRFSLKNLAPVFYGDCAHLPFYRFFPYYIRSREDFIDAWKEFKESKNWILKNKYRWKCGSKGVINRWINSPEYQGV